MQCQAEKRKRPAKWGSLVAERKWPAIATIALQTMQMVPVMVIETKIASAAEKKRLRVNSTGKTVPATMSIASARKSVISPFIEFLAS